MAFLAAPVLLSGCAGRASVEHVKGVTVCSGTLARDAKIDLHGPDFLRRMAEKRARVALTSGGLEPVRDGGGGGHSVFASAFLDVLQGNRSVIEGTRLFSELRRPVISGAPQTPEYSEIRFAGHEGGDFLFVRRAN